MQNIPSMELNVSAAPVAIALHRATPIRPRSMRTCRGREVLWAKVPHAKTRAKEATFR